MRPSLRYERQARAQGASRVAGIDEAGRGPLAGPVVAAAVILPDRFRHPVLTDSKRLSADQRDALYRQLTTHPRIAWAVGLSDVAYIDRFNILRATWRAMDLALAGLQPPPDHVLIDGRPVRPIRVPQTAIVGGDGRSFSIAAASVIAKVTRDRLMTAFHERFPQYNFAQHKGYGTPQHLAAIRRHGPCPIHRQSFAPIRHALELAPQQIELPHPAA